MKILNGKQLAELIKDDVKSDVEHINSNNGDVNLAVIQVGQNEASARYIRNKQKACDYCGITSMTYYLSEDITQAGLCEFIKELNEDNTVTGILVQLPLPEHINEWEVVSTIDPKKDVDGFTAVNAGILARGNRGFNSISPCTPLGIMTLLAYNNIEVRGKHCVVVGRSNIVGRPIAEMLLNDDATVTMCHSYTENLADICKNADILVCAIGKPKFFTKDYIKDGAVVIDVGMNRDENGKLCGDVDLDDVKDVGITITPVPGGVGPLTVASLMINCISAYDLQYND